MPLLFVLAGVSTKFALQKRTNKEYLVERVKRLFVPLVFGTIVLMPIMTYLANRFNYFYSGGFVEHYAIFFTKYTDLICINRMIFTEVIFFLYALNNFS